MDDRKLIDYLPSVLRDVREYNTIVTAEEPEMLRAWEALENILKDNFIDEATEEGVLRLEGILKIIPKAVDTLADRKFRIKAKVNEQLPYTFRDLEERLALLCGSEGYTCELINEDYTLKVRIKLTAKSQFGEVERLLNRIVPANMMVDFSLLYKQHLSLATFTHNQLSTYTHNQLRNEVIA